MGREEEAGASLASHRSCLLRFRFKVDGGPRVPSCGQTLRLGLLHSEDPLLRPKDPFVIQTSPCLGRRAPLGASKDGGPPSQQQTLQVWRGLYPVLWVVVHLRSIRKWPRNIFKVVV